MCQLVLQVIQIIITTYPFEMILIFMDTLHVTLFQKIVSSSTLHQLCKLAMESFLQNIKIFIEMSQTFRFFKPVHMDRFTGKKTLFQTHELQSV